MPYNTPTLLAAAIILAGIAGYATTEYEPVPPTVQPAALICIEAPGTSVFRPCEPWCADHAATHVMRLMQGTDTETGAKLIEWRETSCAEYLAERGEA